MEERRSHLNLDERRKIWKFDRLGYGVNQIARELDRSASTISRELKRNANAGEEWLIRAHLAQELATLRRTKANSSRTRLKSESIQDYVETRLKRKWSPEIIALRIGRDIAGAAISHEAIYQWIREERPDLTQYLKIAGKARRRRCCKRHYRPKAPAAPKVSIDERPAEANDRSVAGHWEGDLIVSRKSKFVILHLKERKTRFSKLRRLHNATAATLKAAVINILGFYPSNIVYSITFDNGSENAEHEIIACTLDTAIYFCHAYHSWEKGTVENGNRRVREDFPKGTDFALVTDEQIQATEDRINNTPLKCLNVFTPAEAFKLELLCGCSLE
jgi:IS30 family transposase